MEQTYQIDQDGTGAYHFSGRTLFEDGGHAGREYASGLDLELVRAAGIKEMAAEVQRRASTIVERGSLTEAQAKADAAGGDLAIVRRQALAKLTFDEQRALDLLPVIEPAKTEG